MGSDDGLTSDHGGGGMVQRPMGGVLREFDILLNVFG